MSGGIVIVGGGQAGVQVADSLRSLDLELPITIIADELQYPYQRPPLSKSLWGDDLSKAAVPLRSAEFFSARDIRLLAGVRAVGIDRDGRRIELDDCGSVPYDVLVIATGARARAIRLPGAELPGVHQLRTLDDGLVLQQQLRDVGSLMVIGGGFVGLEIAASALQHGVKATVFEVESRILRRALTSTTSQWLADFHRRAGMDLRLSTPLNEITPDATGRAAAAITEGGDRVAADVIVAGIGAVPNSELAAEAGLLVDDGVVVDAHLRTEDPAIWAIGDCARFPSHFTGVDTRLESVQNATDQGRIAARNIIAMLRNEALEHYTAVPWFWSNQGDARLQIAGIGNTTESDVVVRDYDDGRISVFTYELGRLTVVESVNAPADHIAARRIIADGGYLDPMLAADPAIPLKSTIQAPTMSGNS